MKKVTLLFIGCIYSFALWSQTINDYLPNAEKGDKEAQFELAQLYYNSRDYNNAGFWYKKAAEQGHVVSQYWLGSCYHYGVGVTKDSIQAMKWYQKAAEQGHADAHYYIGVLYNEGIIESNFYFPITLKKAEQMIFASPEGEPIYLGGATENDYHNSELFNINERYKKNDKEKRAAIREYNIKMYHKLGLTF